MSGRIEIDSAGTIGYHAGNPPDSRMAAILKARGYEIEGRARRIAAADLQRFDLILVADEENLADVRTLDATGEHAGKIRLLVEFCLQHQAPRVPDPYYGGRRGFEEVANLVEDACAGLLESIRREHL